MSFRRLVSNIFSIKTIPGSSSDNGQADTESSDAWLMVDPSDVPSDMSSEGFPGWGQALTHFDQSLPPSNTIHYVTGPFSTNTFRMRTPDGSFAFDPPAVRHAYEQIRRVRLCLSLRGDPAHIHQCGYCSEDKNRWARLSNESLDALFMSSWEPWVLWEALWVAIRDERRFGGERKDSDAPVEDVPLLYEDSDEESDGKSGEESGRPNPKPNDNAVHPARRAIQALESGTIGRTELISFLLTDSRTLRRAILPEGSDNDTSSQHAFRLAAFQFEIGRMRYYLRTGRQTWASAQAGGHASFDLLDGTVEEVIKYLYLPF